jgi:hypothetical protein
MVRLEISSFIRKYLMDRVKVTWNKEFKEMVQHN